MRSAHVQDRARERGASKRIRVDPSTREQSRGHALHKLRVARHRVKVAIDSRQLPACNRQNDRAVEAEQTTPLPHHAAT